MLTAVPGFDEIKVERLGSETSWRWSEAVAKSDLVMAVDIVRHEVTTSNHDSANDRDPVRVVVVGDCDDDVAIAVQLRRLDDRWEVAVDDATHRLFHPFPLVDAATLCVRARRTRIIACFQPG